MKISPGSGIIAAAKPIFAAVSAVCPWLPGPFYREFPGFSKNGLDRILALCYNTQAFKECTAYRGVEQLEARRAHNPEVVGSSPASATIKNSRFLQKTAVFLTFWRLQKLQALRLGVYLGFTPVVDSVFPTFWTKMIFEVKQHFGEKVPESCIQNGKALFLLYNSTEYSE